MRSDEGLWCLNRSFVKEVQVTGNKAVMNYTMPELPDNLTIEKAVVLPTVRYGGRYRTRTCDPLRVKQVLLCGFK
ncbi:MAG: hypothetical protein HY530_08640 [Chloroflexi bacterium]|nr:hypothetical protein [Chloroflexota bacterium]